MHEIATIGFADADSGDVAVMIIRAGDGRVALALSLMHDGDVEVILAVEECDALIKALQQAVLAASSQ